MIKTFLFDFGGVVAEEGFRDGLKAIARKNGLDPDRFFTLADDLVFSTGYLIGNAGEEEFWKSLKQISGIAGANKDLRQEILDAFALRPAMIEAIDQLRAQGYEVIMLSDQTNWLEEIDSRTGLFSHFNRILNSFTIHMSKRDPETFQAVAGLLSLNPPDTIFIDDNRGHIERAAEAGFNTIHFTTISDFHESIGLITGKMRQDKTDSP